MERSIPSVEYAVVGAGPAGAMAARTLAERGRQVTLLDWAPLAEKPCGGGVPARGMERFGSLLGGVARNQVERIRVTGPRGDEATLELHAPLAIFARRAMDEALRRHAERAGALRLAARVVAVEREPDGFELAMRRSAEGPTERIRARYVVAADGAAGLVRRRLLELAGRDAPDATHFSRSVTIYPALATTRADAGAMEIAYVGGADGYGWTFPRTDHASIGWCVQGERGAANSLRGELDRLVQRGALSGPKRASPGARGVGALIPSFRGDVVAGAAVEGRRFALVGDAAGAVDPITREGIHHALATGARLGECDPLAWPGRYAEWYDAELRPELVRSAQLARTFFRPRFLTTMIRALERSEALRELFRDLVAGTQNYVTLKRRLLRSLPRTLPALTLAALRR